MDLALGCTRADSAPANQIGNKLSGHHIEKLGSGGDAELVHLQQQATRQFKAVIHPVAAVQVGVGDQPLPANHRTGLLKIGAHHDFQLRLIAFAHTLQSARILHRRISIVNGTGTDHYQQAAIFTVENFFDSAARSRNVGGNIGGHGMPLRQFRGRYQAFNARGTQFVCFIHWGLKNLFLPRRKCREVMRITINQSLLIARAGHDPV
ncbi:Uncharacterised protein [Klebsiella oxytoca]|nr:Uncharacterised protein [Klebsiella oxytoca]SBL25888.1 Uncharacterised protein [Klebsiella oxytoca]